MVTKSIGVIMVYPAMAYLEEELDKHFTLFRLWRSPDPAAFLAAHSHSVRALVGDASASTNAATIDLLPNLGIVSSFSVGLDKVDLPRCRRRGIRVTNTPDILTDDITDLAIGLILVAMGQICVDDRYLRAGLWMRRGDYNLIGRVRKN